ncbi:hypothetical protein Tco_1396826 [Tanacetum coccineum]
MGIRSLLMENLLRSKKYWSVIERSYEEPGDVEQLTAAQQKALDEAKLKDLKQEIIYFRPLISEVPRNAKCAQLLRFREEFEMLEMKMGESVIHYFGRAMVTTNDMINFGEDMDAKG